MKDAAAAAVATFLVHVQQNWLTAACRGLKTRSHLRRFPWIRSRIIDANNGQHVACCKTVTLHYSQRLPTPCSDHTKRATLAPYSASHP